VKSKRYQTKVVPLNTQTAIPLKTWLSVAAGIALVLTLGYLLLWKSSEQLSVVSGSTLAQIEYYDGSAISLDADAELSYNPKPHKKERRFIQTKGMVYYAVEKNPDKPFVVSTSLAEITVLGTKFMVGLSTDSVVLSVEEGRVKIVPTNNKEAAIVSAGETWVVSSDGKSESKPYSPNAMSWANRQLQFANTPLGEVVKDLEAMYRVEISLDSSLHTCKLTGSFRKKSLEKVLESIAETLDLEVRKSGNRYVIKGKGC
jgi:ferric-dicitrate binding protein FerR (iron transport regulator)